MSALTEPLRHSDPNWLRSSSRLGEWFDEEERARPARPGTKNRKRRADLPRLRDRSARHTRAAQVFAAPEMVSHHRGRRGPALPKVRILRGRDPETGRASSDDRCRGDPEAGKTIRPGAGLLAFATPDVGAKAFEGDWRCS